MYVVLQCDKWSHLLCLILTRLQNTWKEGDVCVCVRGYLCASSVEDFAGERKGLHPLFTRSPASCWHSAAVFCKPEGHKVRENMPIIHIIYVCACVYRCNISPLKLQINVMPVWKVQLSLPDLHLISVFTANTTAAWCNHPHLESGLTSSAFRQLKVILVYHKQHSATLNPVPHQRQTTSLSCDKLKMCLCSPCPQDWVLCSNGSILPLQRLVLRPESLP